MTFKFGGSGGGGGGISSIDATASGAIASGKPAFLKGDGKIVAASGTGSTHALVDALVCDTYNNSTQNACYSSKTIVDRAAGRGILIYCGHSSYNYQGRYKLFSVNSSSGTGAGQNQYAVGSYSNIPVESNYCSIPAGAVWDNNGYWITAHRRNSSGSYDLIMTKIKTSNGYTYGSHYGHDLGNSGVFSQFNNYTGSTALVKDTENNRNYLVMAPNNIYGAAGAVVYGPMTWSSDSNSSLDLGTGATSGSVTPGYMYGSLSACYDAANNQIVVVHSSGAAGVNNYRLIAFTLNQDTGVPSYSHVSGQTRTSGSAADKVEGCAADTSGNICWTASTTAKVYSAKNTGSAFTYGGEINGPSGAPYSIVMNYVEAADQWAAIWTSGTSGTGYTPQVQQFSVSNGVIGSVVKELNGAGSQYAGSSGYAGTYINKVYQGGYSQAINDKGFAFQFGQDTGTSTTSSVNCVQLGLSNVFTTDYIGLTTAAINDAASGTVTTKGSLNTAQSNLVAGGRYFITPTGTVSIEGDLSDDDKSGAVFLGVATNTTTMLVGDSLKVVDSSAIHKNPAKSISSTGYSTSANLERWDNWMAYVAGTTSVSASGTADILKVTGSGTCYYFVISHSSTANTQISVDLIVDGIVIGSPRLVYTSLYRPLSLVGTYSNSYNTTYAGHPVSISVEPINFNTSFAVKRVAGSSTSFQIAYKIIGN